MSLRVSRDVTELIPAEFAARAPRLRDGGNGDGAAFLARLPRLLRECLDQWGLEPDGPSRSGHCAVVVPVRRGSERAALKVGFPHEEARHEHLALRFWGGGGAVRLLAADPSRCALLLERLDPERDLTTIDADAAAEVLGSIAARLARPAPAWAPRVADAALRWAERMRRHHTVIRSLLPPRFVDQAELLLPELAAETEARMVHTDLHHMNVLAGDREPWLAIDPQVVAADPAYGLAPVLWNRWEEAVASGDPKWETRRRAGIWCDAAGADEDHARAWTIVRVVNDVAWREDVGLRQDDFTAAVTILKAMQRD